MVPRLERKQIKDIDREDCICGIKKYKVALCCLHDWFVFLNQLYNVFPWIMKFLPGSHQTLFSNWKKLELFVSRMLENHKKDWNPAETRDFIDAYLKEMSKVMPWSVFSSFN